MRHISESIIGKRGSVQDTGIISQCKDMITKINTSPWRDAVNLASAFYDELLANRNKYPVEVRQIIEDSIKEWSGKALSKIARTDIMIQTIRSISNLAKKQRS